MWKFSKENKGSTKKIYYVFLFIRLRIINIHASEKICFILGLFIIFKDIELLLVCTYKMVFWFDKKNKN